MDRIRNDWAPGRRAGILAGFVALVFVLVLVLATSGQANPTLDAVTQVDCNPSQTYGDAGDQAAAQALAADGFLCTALLNKGQLQQNTFQRVGELWHRQVGTILQSRVIFFGGSNTGFVDSKLCLDDDGDPINNIAPGGANPVFCEGQDASQSFNQVIDNGPIYPPAKAANVAPEEPAGKFEIKIEGLVEISELRGGATVGGWNINIDGYTEALPHFNKGLFSIVAYFQPGPQTTICNGTIGMAIVVGNVVVPPGASCTLNGTTVTGNVLFGQGSQLLTQDANIAGDIQGEGGLRIRIYNTVVTDILLKGVTFQIIIGSDMTCKADPLVLGRIQLAENSARIGICKMSTLQDVQLTKNTGRILVDDNIIGTNLQVEENTQHVRLRFNEVAGNIQVNKNTGGVMLNGNTAGMSIMCSDNNPPPVSYAPNTAPVKTGQCAGL